jgi:hypothetical protein
MGNISDHLPKESKTVQAIYDHYKTQGDKGYMSRTLSVSLLGRPCERYLWYSFRQCVKPSFDGRMYRLFERGDLEEARLTADLQAIGCQIHVIDESTGKQFKVEAFGGHLKGYMDGCALGIPEAPRTWHVLEYKTHNAKSFAALKKKGLKESKPEHYAQMMIYMHLTKMQRALYLAVNKDTDEIYAERVRYDKPEAEVLMEKARRIIVASEPPDRIGGRPDWYECRWCDAKTICWGTNHPKDILGEIPDSPALPVPSLSCRQCCHATPLLGREHADWKCEKGFAIPEGEIWTDTCPSHLTLPGLLPFAEPGDYGGNDIGHEWIEFRNENGTTWRHGSAPGCISSEELTKIPASILGNETVQAAKDLFGATITGHEMDILQRYPESDSRIIWKGPSDLLVEEWQKAYGEKLNELKPIARSQGFQDITVELPGGRIAILWTGVEPNWAEIREGVE